ncbi:glycoside hydrolase family 16 protein [Actinoplanes utahensis]|uniref:glycoside hydrolase family 16 protein n=2 Tax=Actinoplanes utahensis TaxID=1869 RepID=UPI001EF3A46A|nr:glycoside hydrolase family 16 protein [Actinoplanes utahensis]
MIFDAAPDLSDDFTGPGLRPDLWIDHYLPHWSTPDRSRARYDFGGRPGSGLRLRIDADQPDWRPEDAPLRVSNIQTGTFSGPLGSATGTHRHRPDALTVRTETGPRLLWTPSAGRVDVTVSASRDEGCMLAAWLVGAELDSRDSGEICIFEIDAAAVGEDAVTARLGIKAHHDDRLHTDMTEVRVPVDAARPHTWSVTWGLDGTVISCAGTEVGRFAQAPDYPLILMLDLFETAGPSPSPTAYPKTAVIHRVRGWSVPA